jgi:hypothetical protein|tara:strand:+ start:18675 stop:18776 length:102 start_codon:yes stop_codon:yes gene_type:complete
MEAIAAEVAYYDVGEFIPRLPLKSFISNGDMHF